MKKALVIALVMGLLAGLMLMPAEAKKKKKKPVKTERVVEYVYQGPGIGISTPAAVAGYCYPEPTTCASFVPELGEKYITIEVIDASGTTIAGSINQGDLDGDGIGDLYGEFCGAHTEPLELQNATAPFQLSMYSGSCFGTPSPSVMTTGTVKITFSNML